MSEESSQTHNASCRADVAVLTRYREKLPQIVEKIIANCDEDTCYTHIDYEPIPSRASVIDIIQRLRGILFPGYFSNEKLDPINMGYTIGQAVTSLFDLLAEQICLSIRHDCFRYEQACVDCTDRGNELALAFLESIPRMRRLLATDISAVYEGDPAAKSHDEIIFSYPGVFALMVYRVAHKLSVLEVPLLPRIMTEYAHSVTGIDIHPGATIGEGFVIDHGTGVVIGETTHIGKNVRIYQGVTLGALSLPRDAGERLRGTKRHPTIEDGVIIYSGATILGGDTVIGAHSIVGGNVWITASVPPHTKVIMNEPELKYMTSKPS
ncbi:MAG: serine acetyltransferase [Deltaproteobacteria bacterium]|nr:serine acetyltransferase [Deltaproteobacteria bacterium]